MPLWLIYRKGAIGAMEDKGEYKHHIKFPVNSAPFCVSLPLWHFSQEHYCDSHVKVCLGITSKHLKRLSHGMHISLSSCWHSLLLWNHWGNELVYDLHLHCLVHVACTFSPNGWVRPSGRSLCSFSEVRQLYSWIHHERCERVTSHFSVTGSQTPEGAARIIVRSQGEESSLLSLSALAIAALVRHTFYTEVMKSL